MPQPTVRLALVAAIGALAVFVSDHLAGFVAVNVVLVTLVLLDRLRTLDPAALHIERSVPAVLALHAPSSLAWHMTNPTDATVSGELADELAPSLGATTRRTAFTLAPRQSARVEVGLHPSRRGAFELIEVAVRTYGPLGLVARQRRLELPATVRVYPSFRSREEAELRINRARILEVGLRSATGRGGGTEFDQLREYSPDDEFRRIDWAATARSSTPIVRTFRAERNQTVVNLLDNGRVMAGQVAGTPRVELAMDAVMMLTSVATRMGDRAGLVAFDSEVRAVVPPGHGRSQLGKVTEAMYALEPALAESDYSGAFTTTLGRFRRRMLLVLYTDLVEQAVGEMLLPALKVIVRHHLVLVASVQDPDVVRWAASAAGDSEQAYRRAAAAAALDERRRTTRQLTALGVRVVDAPPDKLASRLADAYLRLKATGGL